jgi:hypothetical protein
MPVFLVNANPAFPFTRMARQYGLDLYEEWQTLPAVADYCGVADVANRRPIWGYWPRSFNANKALIRSHLDEILQIASAPRGNTGNAGATSRTGRDNPNRNYVWLALVSELWLKAQRHHQQGSETGPIDRNDLEYLNRKMLAANPAAAARSSRAKLAVVDNLIRVLAIPVDADPDDEMQATALSLVEERLVDSVIFLVHDQNWTSERERLIFAALRLITCALENEQVFGRFRRVGADQLGTPTARVYLERRFLGVTESDRRLSFLHHVLDEANTEARNATTDSLAQQTEGICDRIEKDIGPLGDEMSEETLSGAPPPAKERSRADKLLSGLYLNLPKDPCKASDTSIAFEAHWVATPNLAEAIRSSSERYKRTLANHVRTVQENWFDGGRQTARDWSEDDAKVMKHVFSLSSGTSGTRQADVEDLQKVGSGMRKFIDRAATVQRKRRGSLRPHSPEPQEEYADPLYRKLTISGTGKEREIAITGPTMEYGNNANGALGAERALFALPPGIVAVVLFGIVLTIACSFAVAASGMFSMPVVLQAMSVDPTTISGIAMLGLLALLACWVLAVRYGKWRRTAAVALIAAVVSVVAGAAWHFSQSLGKGTTLAEAFREIGWHPLAPFVLLFIFSFIAAIGFGMASARSKFARWRLRYETAAKELEKEAVGPLENAKSYSATHFAMGWLRALDGRLDELELELSNTDAAQNVHADIGRWSRQDNQVILSEADRERATQTVEDLIGAPRSTWVLLAARKFPKSVEHELDVERTGMTDPIKIKNSIFTDVDEDAGTARLSFHVAKD